MPLSAEVGEDGDVSRGAIRRPPLIRSAGPCPVAMLHSCHHVRPWLGSEHTAWLPSEGKSRLRVEIIHILENAYEPQFQNGPVHSALPSASTPYRNLCSLLYREKLQNQPHFTPVLVKMHNLFFPPNCHMGLTLGIEPHGSLSKGCSRLPSEGPT